MSETALSTLLTAVILGALAVWVPLLETFAWLNPRPRKHSVAARKGHTRDRVVASAGAGSIAR